MPLAQRALTIREKARGPDHPDVASALNNLAALYYKQGRYADAEPLLKRSLAIREKAFGPDHPDVAQALNNLSNLYVIHGRYADAEPLFKQALAISGEGVRPRPSQRRDVAEQSSFSLPGAKAAMPTLSRSTSERWRSRRRHSVPTIPMSRQA